MNINHAMVAYTVAKNSINYKFNEFHLFQVCTKPRSKPTVTSPNNFKDKTLHVEKGDIEQWPKFLVPTNLVLNQHLIALNYALNST